MATGAFRAIDEGSSRDKRSLLIANGEISPFFPSPHNSMRAFPTTTINVPSGSTITSSTSAGAVTILVSNLPIFKTGIMTSELSSPI